MTPKSFSRLLLLLALLNLLAVAARAQPRTCGVPPNGQPWGCDLQQPPAIRPAGGVLDTSFVMRERKMYVPVWTPSLCKGTFKVCTADKDCGGQAGSCANAQTCSNAPHAACEDSSTCNPNAKCVNKSCANFPAKVCTGDSDCALNNCVQTWGWQEQTLRPYGSPKDPTKPINPANPDDPNLRWGYPGPVLYARATTLKDPAQPPGPSNPPVTQGTRLKVKLFNYLPVQSYQEAMRCNPANYRYCTNRVCSNDDTKVCTQDADCGSGNTCNAPSQCGQYLTCGGAQGPCGAPQPVQQEAPNCFHGDSVTNLHLHGTHVSPQPHQDYVLLNLFPFGSTGVPTGKPNYAVGSYQVDVNPLPWNQPPGTHWYHPHKHGSTSYQVQGGMAGALIVEGAFDDWLSKLYGGKLVDRVMAVQQISGSTNFFNPGRPNYPPQLLLNGSASPVIKMRPGEIQRFRFVGGSTQAAATLEIGIDPRVEIRQIAQDGVQFAWQNYDRQPLRDTEGTYNNFKLGPGNRVDFLVKAPATPGIYSINRRTSAPLISPAGRVLFNLNEPIAERVPPTLVPTDQPPVDQGGNPLLFTIEVAGTPSPMSFPVTQGTDPACQTSPKPDRCWPDTPYYLRDLSDPGGDPVKLAFSINGEPAAQPNGFYINNTQYCPSCAGVTMTRGATENWLVSNVLGENNTTRLAHPFHIHTNPFQVIRNADRTFEPPYIWWDSLALPVPGEDDRPAGPIWSNTDAQAKCPRACQAGNGTWNGQWTTTIFGQLSVCGCEIKSDNFAIRQRFDDYTGGYVIHCHFLGHEDRGMMWNVQTVCDKPGTNIYGQPQASGGADNCSQSSSLKPLPACTSTCPDEGHAGH
jgi:FtsP/CotA-like multicopper oxidase with cupredoxin domain